MSHIKNTISHLTYATEWNHVNVAYLKEADLDGSHFSTPTEKSLDDKAVVAAARALEKAVIKALGGAESGDVRTMRTVREAQRKAQAEDEDLSLLPSPLPARKAAKKRSK